MENTIVETNGVKIDDIRAIRAAVTVNMMNQSYEKKLDRWSQLSRVTFQWFLDNDDMDEHLTAIVNKLKGDKNIEGALNAMAIRMKPRRALVDTILKQYGSIYAIEYGKLVLSASIIDALGYMGTLPVEIKDGRYKDAITGKIKLYTSNWYLFKEKKIELVDPETNLPFGLHARGGELGGTKLNLKTWESDLKFCKEQKSFLRDIASFAWRLIKHDRAWWENFYENEKWYIEGIKNSDKPGHESRASIKDRKRELIDIVMSLYDYDRLYFSYTFQISGRVQAILSLEGIAPQGSGKQMWEHADGKIIDRLMVKEARIDATKMWAKVHNRGTITSIKAENLWRANRKKVLAWLIGDHKKIKDSVYLEGLHEIITAKIGSKTHKLVGRDLTTNGVGIFSTNYALVKPAMITNIGGDTGEVGDPHTVVGAMLGKTRKEAKDSGINAGLFHGQNIKNISKNSGVSVRELVIGLNNVFGREWTYFNIIARHIGTTLIDNMHTSTRMQSPEGWYFINQSYVEKSVVTVKFFSFETDTLFRQVTVIRDMPAFWNDKARKKMGNIIYKDPDGNSSNNGVAKLSGAYANTIHMLDAWMLRQVIRYVNAPIHTIHDNFYLVGNKLKEVAEVIRACHVQMKKYNYLERNINYMIKQSGMAVESLKLPRGNLTDAEILSSTEFLQP